MKNIMLLFSLSFLSLFVLSCDKEETNTDSNLLTIDRSALKGSWELREISGMIVTNYTKGNGNILHFEDSTYQHYRNGTIIKSGSYHLVKDTTVSTSTGLAITPGQFTHRIVFDNDLTEQKKFFEVYENKLVLLSGFFPVDAGSRSTYEKQTTPQ